MYTERSFLLSLSLSLSLFLFSLLHFRVRQNLHTRERIAGSGRTSGSDASQFARRCVRAYGENEVAQGINNCTKGP